jgi:hypothetical protein
MWKFNDHPYFKLGATIVQMDGWWPLGTTATFSNNVALDGDNFNLQFFDINSMQWEADAMNLEIPNISLGANTVVTGGGFSLTLGDVGNELSTFRVAADSYLFRSGSAGTGATATFSPGSALAGLNVGAVAGNPSGLTNGDLWYNSSTGALMARIGGTTVDLGQSPLTSTQVGYGSGSNTMTSEAALAYNATSNVLTSGDVSIGNGGVISTTPGGTLTVGSGGSATTTNILGGTASGTLNIGSSSGALTGPINIVNTSTGDITIDPGDDIIIAGTVVFSSTPPSSDNPSYLTIDGSGNLEVSTNSNNIIDGTYTPTIDNGFNLASSTSAVCQYMRTGFTATVSGVVSVTPTGTGAVFFDVSLPFAAVLTLIGQAGGGGTSEAAVTGVQAPVYIRANTSTNAIRFTVVAASTNVHSVSFQFMYRNITPL